MIFTPISTGRFAARTGLPRDPPHSCLHRAFRIIRYCVIEFAKAVKMIVDFQHHFTPRELIKEDPGDRLILHYDAQGAPSYTIHSLLYDLDEHVKMMDTAGIDAAWLTSAQGMCADLETSRFVNRKAKQAEKDYPGRFIGAAHAHPLGGAEAVKELNRCKHELGFEGVVIPSETVGLFLDNPQFEPFWTEVARLGMFVFVHP